MTSEKIDSAGRAAYGTGAYGIFIGWMTVNLYLLYFYTDVMGLSPAQAGTVFAVASLWDALTDFAMGWVVERTRSRWGRYRPYLLWATPAFGLSLVALFWLPALAGAALFWWAIAIHIVFRTAYTLVYIPYTALITRLTKDPRERSRIGGTKQIFISLGSLTVSATALPAVSWLGAGDEALGFLRFALVAAFVSSGMLWLCFSCVSEQDFGDDATSSSKTEPVGLLRSLKLLARNGPFIGVILGVFLFTGCYTMMNKAIVYLFKYVLGDRDAASLALSAIAVAGIVSPFLWVRLAVSQGKRAVWMAGSLLAAGALLGMWIIQPSSPWIMVPWFFIVGCGINGFLMTFFALAADTVEHGERMTGIRIEGPVFGMVALANKLSLAVGSWGLGQVLAVIGFQGQATSAPSGVEPGLWLATTLLPAVGYFASAAVASRISVRG